MTQRRLSWWVIASLVAAFAGSAFAQSDAERARMEYERQQREYWRAQEAQRIEEARRRNEEIRLQQEREAAARREKDSADAARRRDDQYEQDAKAARGRQQQALQDSADHGAKLEAARQAWLKKPALDDARNPLLGRWSRPPTPGPSASDPFAMVTALMKGGLCELFFGGGTFEFRSKSLVAFDARTPPKEIDEVQYRGDGRNVVVIPKTTFKLLVFEFDGPNRINWQGQDCVLTRVGAQQAAATPAAVSTGGSGAAGRSTTANVAAGAGAGQSAAGAASGAVLSVAVSVGSGAAATPHAGAVLYVLRHDAEQTLRRGGFQPRPGHSILKTWSLECQQRSQACAQGAQLLQADALGFVRADAQGKAQTPPIAPGVYYLFGSKRQGTDEIFWNRRIELKPGTNAVALDSTNGFVPQ